MESNVRKITCNLIAFFSPLYLGISVISNGLARKVIILYVMLLGICVFEKKRKKDVLFIIAIVFFVFYNIFRFGLSYAIHLHCYGFIFFLQILYLFVCDDYLDELNTCIYSLKKAYSIIGLFYGILFLNVLLGNGLSTSSEWGISGSILWGPFELPHILAYMQITMFCFAAMLYRKYQNNFFLGVMLVACICTLWTGVRSATLALAVVVFTEYLSIKSSKTKFFVFVAGICASLYLIFFTDIVASSPIIQKTLTAVSNGSISNGRENFNSYLLDIYFRKLSVNEKIVGISIPNIQNLMYLKFGDAIQAHNDFLNTLLGMGIIGFSVFTVTLFGFCNKCRKWIAPFVVFSLLAFTNGLFMYTGFVACMPIVLLYYISIYGRKRRQRNLKGDF